MLLVDEFLRKMSRIAESVVSKSHDPLVKSGLSALYQAVKSSEKICFAPSTMKMLTEELTHVQQTFDEVLARLDASNFATIYQRATAFGGAWVEFDKPIVFPGKTGVAAMFCFPPARHLATGKDGYQLYLIDQFAEVFDLLECSQIGEAWVYVAPIHRCAQCHREQGVLIPCEGCEHLLGVWANIWALSAIIAGQYLAAMRYEEKMLTGMRREKRAQSKKERRVPVKHLFKVIDANEIIIQIPTAEKSEQLKDVRGSWIVEGEVEYREIRTRPFMRTYRHERYKASGLQGTTVKFPEGIRRMQPRKKEQSGKQVTKVKASLYEEGNPV